MASVSGFGGPSDWARSFMAGLCREDEDKRTKQWWDFFENVPNSKVAFLTAQAIYCGAADGDFGLWLIDLCALFHAADAVPALKGDNAVQADRNRLANRYPSWRRKGGSEAA